MKRIVLTGGGSGGHFYPLIAVAEEMNKYNQPEITHELYYLGPNPYRQEVLERNNVKFIRIPSGKKTKYFSVGNLFSPFKMLWGLIIALKELYFIYPDVIFSKGSYTSVPVVLAAWLLRIPIVVHESDTLPGSANRLGAKFARYIAIAFDDVAPFFPTEKTALIGIPLRQAIKTQSPDPATALGLPTDRPIILVTGGSLGAQRINDLIIESLDDLLPTYTIIHQTGENNAESVQQTSASLIKDHALLDHYFVRGRLTAEEMSLAESAASLIISRAGAGSIFEIAEKGKPSIIVPIPEKISHDQRTNAFAYARSGAAHVIEEHNLTDGLLFAEITRIMSDTQLYTKMSVAATTFSKPKASEKIVETLVGIAAEHK